MSPRRTRRGTIRENTNDISINNSLKSISKSVRSSRRVNKSHIAKGSEEESDNPVEINNLADNTVATSFLNDTSTNTRNRRRKLQEISTNEENLLSMTVEGSTNSKTKKSNIKSPRSKKQNKNTKTQINDASLLISEDESFNKKSNRRVSYATVNLISEDEEVPQKTTRSRKKIKLDHQASFTQRKDSITPEKSLTGNVTPKTSSPLNVSFTPHRSTKTPKKSPMNLGSPKTHSRYSLKALNVPRKLPITDSPPSSEQSNSPLQHPESNIGNDLAKSKTKNETKAKSKLSNKKKSTSPTLKIKSRFSKSPKIVLKTPKSKTSKMSSPKKSPKSTSPKKSQVSKKGTISVELKESQEFDSSLKSEEIITKVDSSKKLNNSSKITSPTESNKSQKHSELDRSLNRNTSLNLKKTPGSSSKSKKSSKSMLIQSKKSPKITLPLISKKMPKIVLNLKSKKSPFKSPKNSSLSKSTTSPVKKVKTPSPSKSKKSPVKTPKTPLPSKSKKSLVKTPKIPSPSKSKKSPVKTSKTSSPLQTKKSPIKTPKTSSPPQTKKSPIKTLKISSPPQKKKLPVKTSKTPSPSKSSKTTSPSKVGRSSIKLQIRKSIASNDLSRTSSMSPRVVVNKLSTPQLKNPTLTSKTNQPSIKLIPVDHAVKPVVTPKQQKISPKSVKSSIKRQSTFTMKPTTPARTIKTQLNISKKSNETNLSFISTTPSYLNKNRSILKPKNTSTPRERFTQTSHLASNQNILSINKSKDLGKVNKLPYIKSKAIKRLDKKSQIGKDHPLLEDESEPSFDDSSLIHMSDVFDSDNSQKNSTFEITKNSPKSPRKKTSPKSRNTSQKSNKSDIFEFKGKSTKDNNTYEVENPKTPGLQNKSQKRRADEAELSTEEQRDSKRNCRVHFTTPNLGNQVQSSSINRLGTPGHAIQQKRTPISQSKTRTPLRQSLVDRVESRQRLNSLSQAKVAINTPINKRRSISLSDSTLKSRKSNHEILAASVKRLSRPRVFASSEKKQGPKTPAATKIPNFAEIHKKNFAKMESLVDLKKRVEKRHVVNSVTSSIKKTNVPNQERRNNKLAPIDLTNGSYNRFGFKLRKSDAVNIISKKQVGSKDSREKKREEARNTLKGVRMNRRFELQMKSRIKNS